MIPQNGFIEKIIDSQKRIEEELWLKGRTCVKLPELALEELKQEMEKKKKKS